VVDVVTVAFVGVVMVVFVPMFVSMGMFMAVMVTVRWAVREEVPDQEDDAGLEAFDHCCFLWLEI
jgi:hypothetical protein